MDGFPPQQVRHDSSGSFATCPFGLSLLLGATERRFSMTSPMQLVAGVGFEPHDLDLMRVASYQAALSRN